MTTEYYRQPDERRSGWSSCYIHVEGNLTLLSKILTLLSTVFSHVWRNYWRNLRGFGFVVKMLFWWSFLSWEEYLQRYLALMNNLRSDNNVRLHPNCEDHSTIIQIQTLASYNMKLIKKINLSTHVCTNI